MENLIRFTLNAQIRELRKKRGLRQEDLASLVGVSKDTVTRWESGKREPGAEALKKLAVALETSIAYLMGETDNPAIADPLVQSEINTLGNVKATALNNSITNVNGTINTNERNTENRKEESTSSTRQIVMKFKRPLGEVELSFPLGTPREEMDYAIAAALLERTIQPESLLKPASGGDIAKS
jgi:transcriptional regulator with XRE-family HTH domain